MENTNRKTWKPPEDTEYFYYLFREDPSDLESKNTHTSKWHWHSFKPYEFKCNGTGMFKMATIHLDRLQRLRNDFGHPVIITSGYRHPSYNKTIRGAVPNSTHTHGHGTDISVRHMTPHMINRFMTLAESIFPCVIAYPDDGFVHVDSGLPYKSPRNKEFLRLEVQKKEPIKASVKRKDTQAISAGTIISAAPSVIQSIGGLMLPTWLTAGAFIAGLLVVGFVLYKKYKD